MLNLQLCEYLINYLRFLSLFIVFPRSSFPSIGHDSLTQGYSGSRFHGYQYIDHLKRYLLYVVGCSGDTDLFFGGGRGRCSLSCHRPSGGSTRMSSVQWDHTVHYVNNLDAVIAQLSQYGIRAFHGGTHPRWGTCNALSYFGLAYHEFLSVACTTNRSR